jgi:hypothetical protein
MWMIGAHWVLMLNTSGAFIGRPHGFRDVGLESGEAAALDALRSLSSVLGAAVGCQR